jgi:predicted DNA-binding WGR domain protein
MNYKFIGWCREGKHDKVWGVIELHSNAYVIFWGRRGAKLQTKIYEDKIWGAQVLINLKRGKGYHEVKRHELDTVYPEFQADLEKTAFWAMFKV